MSPSQHTLDLREFGDWPLSWRAAACMALMLLACGLPWVVLTRPASAERQALVVVANELHIRLRHAREQADALPPVPSEHAGTASLPLPDIPVLMTAIAECAQAAGLRDGKFRPLPVISAATEMEDDTNDRIELRLHGTWQQLGRFASDLAALTPDAILSLRDIHLRASSDIALLELTAIVAVYPHSANDLVFVSEQSRYGTSGRNPFAVTTARPGRTSAQAVVGRIRNGHGQAGLVLGADGQLHRVAMKTSNQD